jgi:methylmalonyl-CoA mutase C-terminal domain/subunit
VVARALRDAGMEVVYTGIRQTPRQIVDATLQEDADCLAISILSGAHNALFPEIMRLLKEAGIADEVLVLAGGIIPEEDVPKLKEIGIREVFGPGTTTASIVSYIRDHVRKE